MDENFSLGDRLRYIRFSKGLSQEKVALRAEITTAYYGLVERNRKNPTVKILDKICQALGITLIEVFNQSQTSSKEYDELTMQIISQLNGQSDEMKQVILNVIKQIVKLK
ncbi:MAG: helix-turn-helix transcriptional regulator [Spirochaetales bacterium]|nr:helix-turn-helix transcriptional regulator [Spirochaetales bacterium]